MDRKVEASFKTFATLQALAQAVEPAAMLFDLTTEFYLNGFNVSETMLLIRKLDAITAAKRVHLVLALRRDLLSNEFLYLVPRVLQFFAPDNSGGQEEMFSRCSKTYPVILMAKAGSSRLEVEDRLEFTLQNGFAFKSGTSKPVMKASQSSVDVEMSSTGGAGGEALILVEDSDRDSEDEMEADADF